MSSTEIVVAGPRSEVVSSSHNAPAGLAPPQRVVSLDALRGFDMFWIIGADGIAAEIVRLLPDGSSSSFVGRALNFVAGQLSHKAWEGMAFEDLIFPLFVFIVGVSLVFSLSKALSQRDRRSVVFRILSRSALLYLFGLMAYHGFDQPIHAFAGQTGGTHAVRWLGVLQRIAICYAVAALLFCLFRPRVLVLCAIAFIAGYWVLMAYVNVPGVGRGSYAEGKNLANYIDQLYLGGYKWDGDHDPEGLLSTIPAIATCLLGVFAGLLLQIGKYTPYTKVGLLLLCGAGLAATGYAWGFVPSAVQFPVVKKLWTSSFVLLAGGYSAMLLGIFYLVMDIWKLRIWAMPFMWIGTNAITLYMLVELGFIQRVAELLVGSRHHPIPIIGSGQPLLVSLIAMSLTIALARFLYRRGLFIRV